MALPSCGRFFAGVCSKRRSTSAGGRNCAGARLSGSLQPSNHSHSNGLPPEAGTPANFQTMCVAVGQTMSFTLSSAFVSVSATTESGAAFPSDMPFQTADMRWQPMSPIQPEPRSRHTRQMSGW